LGFNYQTIIPTMIELAELKDFFYELNHIIQSLFGGLFTWGLTALGAGLVFFTQTVNQKVLDAISGVEAAGGATIASAIVLAVGIGIQNFPEGTAVSVPLRREGISVGKSFWYGQLSGVVEPISAVIGAAAVLMVQPLLPYALAFAAGAMIYVVVEELIPESQLKGNTDIATLGTMVGFSIMMLLDVALG